MITVAHPELYRRLMESETPHRFEHDAGSFSTWPCARCGCVPGMLTTLDTCPIQPLTLREKALVRKLRCLHVLVSIAEYNREAGRLNDAMLDAWLVNAR